MIAVVKYRSILMQNIRGVIALDIRLHVYILAYIKSDFLEIL